MGHSILVYDERHVRLHDVDLIVTVLLLVTTWRQSLDASEAAPDEQHGLRQAIDAMERAVMTWSVGYMNVELDEIVTSDEVRRGLVRSLIAAQVALERVDHLDGVELVRAAFGPDDWGPGGVTIRTTKAAVGTALAAIRSLLSARDAPPPGDA